MFSSANNLRYRVLLGMSLQMFQQLSGINATMFYYPDILSSFYSDDVSLYGTVGLNGINFLATFITIYAVDRWGRVRLLLVGGLTMLVMLGVLAALSALTEGGADSPGFGVGVILASCAFVISFAYSWGPIVWVITSEIFPVRSRGKGAGLTTASNWIFTGVVGAVFPTAQNASLAGTFCFFAGMILLGTLTVYLFLPETANLTILQIDAVFDAHRPRVCRPAACCGGGDEDSSVPGSVAGSDKDAKAGKSSSYSPACPPQHPACDLDRLALECPERVRASHYDRRTGEHYLRESYRDSRASRDSAVPVPAQIVPP